MFLKSGVKKFDSRFSNLAFRELGLEHSSVDEEIPGSNPVAPFFLECSLLSCIKVHLMHFIIYLKCFQTQGFLEDVSNLKEHG